VARCHKQRLPVQKFIPTVALGGDGRAEEDDGTVT
jgi:hypothetical protein